MTYLSEWERLLIYRWLAVWDSKYEIAKKIWRSHTTIGREIDRNKDNKWEYNPFIAEDILGIVEKGLIRYVVNYSMMIY